jgi:thiamine monophosphate kinase
LFGEGQSRIIISLHPDHIFDLRDIMASSGVPYRIIGKVGGEGLEIIKDGKKLIKVSISQIKDAYFKSIPAKMGVV